VLTPNKLVQFVGRNTELFYAVCGSIPQNKNLSEKIKLRILILVIAFVAFPLAAVAETSSVRCGFFEVPPDSEALVFDRSGGIKRKLGPGRQRCIPFLETVSIVNTLRERRQDIESLWSADRCNVTASVIWRVSDLEKYQTKGGEVAAVSMIQSLALEALKTAETSGNNIEAVSQDIHAALRHKRPAFEEFGVALYRSYSNVDCGAY
jgi:regulator of protease activity HflC (stomatin/prohibitin superfamily)